MVVETPNASRTTHLIALMKKGDDAFNARDFAAMKVVHHPQMVAHITGSPEPIRGQSAHAEAMKAMIAAFPDVRVDNDPYSIQFGSGDWITMMTRTKGTFTGEMTLPGGKVLAPTEKPFDLDFATDRQVGRRPAHRRVRLLGLRTAGAAAVEGHPLDVFIAGDDAQAKARVSAFIESLGLRPMDTGQLPWRGRWNTPAC